MRHRETKTIVKADFRLIKNNHPYEINYNIWKMRGSLFYESEAVTGTGYDVIKDGVADSLNASLISNPRKKTVGITPEITIMQRNGKVIFL